MNLIVLLISSAATISLAAGLPLALPLDLVSNPSLTSQSSVFTLTPSSLKTPSSNLSLPVSYLPDRRFKVVLAIGAPLLPINSALINILSFMSLVAQQDFRHQLQPRTFSTMDYRDVQITTYAWTESRFLLWGIYCAVTDMVKYARFHNLALQLYWEDKLVGQIVVEVKRALSLAGGAGNLTEDFGDHLAQANQTASGGDAPQFEPVVGNAVDGDLAPLTFSRINASDTLSTPPTFAISFESIAGADQLDRNEVFLTFINALLHVAQFPAETQMQPFQSDSPSGKLYLYMQANGIGCQVSQNSGTFVVHSTLMEP